MDVFITSGPPEFVVSAPRIRIAKVQVVVILEARFLFQINRRSIAQNPSKLLSDYPDRKEILLKMP